MADVFGTRGAVDRVHLAAGDTVWSIASDGEAASIFRAPPAAEVIAIDAAPSAQQVAVLLNTNPEHTGVSEILILDSTGKEVKRLGELGTALATPVAETRADWETIDWSPQGDRALVASPSGNMLLLPVGESGEPSDFNASRGGDSVRQPTLSPTGESIAFLADSSDGEQTLRMLDTRDGSVREVVAPTEGRIIVDFVWMPDGVSLLFTEGGKPGGPTVGIDLWRVDAIGEQRELVASAGTVAPVARIVHARPSPDGGSVAYAVLVPGPAGPQVDSLWVRDLASRLGFRIPLPSVASVEDLWWTDRGLAVWVTTGSEGQARADTQAVLQIEPGGSVDVIWAAPLPQATPTAGTPAATPGSR